jgi:hypothetical protein
MQRAFEANIIDLLAILAALISSTVHPSFSNCTPHRVGEWDTLVGQGLVWICYRCYIA